MRAGAAAHTSKRRNMSAPPPVAGHLVSAASLSPFLYAQLEPPENLTPVDLAAFLRTSAIPASRLASARRFGSDETNSSVHAICETAKDSEWLIREAVALRLPFVAARNQSNREGMTMLLAAAMDLAKDERKEVREVGVVAVAKVGALHPDKMALVGQALQLSLDPSATNRASGCTCIGHAGVALGSKICKEFFLRALVVTATEDLSFVVRKSAVAALARVAQEVELEQGCCEKVATVIIEKMCNDPAWPVRRVAVAEALPAIVKRLATFPAVLEQAGRAMLQASETDSSAWVRRAARASCGIFLGNFPSFSPSAKFPNLAETSPLFEGLLQLFTNGCNDSSDVYVRLASAYALPAVVSRFEQLSTPRVFENCLVKLAHDEHESVRACVASSLHETIRMAGPSLAARTVFPLFAELANDNADSVRLKALSVSSKILHELAVFELTVGNPKFAAQASSLLTVWRDARRASVAPSASASSYSRDLRTSLASQLGLLYPSALLTSPSSAIKSTPSSPVSSGKGSSKKPSTDGKPPLSPPLARSGKPAALDVPALLSRAEVVVLETWELSRDPVDATKRLAQAHFGVLLAELDKREETKPLADDAAAKLARLASGDFDARLDFAVSLRGLVQSGPPRFLNTFLEVFTKQTLVDPILAVRLASAQTLSKLVRSPALGEDVKARLQPLLEGLKRDSSRLVAETAQGASG